MGGIEQNKPFMTAAGLLPERLWRAAFSIPEEQRERVEELRLRIGRPFCAVIAGKTAALAGAVTRDELEELLQRATQSSVHTYAHQIRQGFITVPSGHRIGLCGETVEERGQISTLRAFSSCNIRIARQFVGLADRLCAGLYAGGFSDTLIVAPPGAGKTTLLRDMVRSVSGRYRVALADERMEIAACCDGEPQFDVGQCDVMSGGCKGDIIPMLLRTMSPQIIALDEITEERDVQTLIAAAYTGCRFLSTAHACALDELNWRPVYKALMGQGIFRNIIAIDAAGGCRRYQVFTEGERENDQTAGRTADRGVVLGGRFFHEQPA